MNSRLRAVCLGAGLAAVPLSLLVGVVPAGASPSGPAAQGAAPPGNNGTIKIDGSPMDAGHDNDPHPGCTFTLEFFGFDAGSNTADVTFAEAPPTGRKTLLTDHFQFTDTRDHGGATFDTARQYDLSPMLAGAKASQQGYHVKVSASVDGGNAKHKVFWVSACTAGAAAARSNAAATGNSNQSGSSGATGSTDTTGTGATGSTVTTGTGAAGSTTGSTTGASSSGASATNGTATGAAQEVSAVTAVRSGQVASTARTPSQVAGATSSRTVASGTSPRTAATGVTQAAASTAPSGTLPLTGAPLLGLLVSALLALGAGVALWATGRARAQNAAAATRSAR